MTIALCLVDNKHGQTCSFKEFLKVTIVVHSVEVTVCDYVYVFVSPVWALEAVIVLLE